MTDLHAGSARAATAGRLALFSTGLLGLGEELRHMSGLEPKFSLLSPGKAEAVGGWGHKSTAARARKAAIRSGLPYIAFEDGFLRSLKPGPKQRPSALVMDRSGIYYDSRGPSDLESLLESGTIGEDERTRAGDLLGLMQRHRLSKYNHGIEPASRSAIPQGSPLVVVVDQTFGDASIAGAMAGARTFQDMAEAAAAENPGARIIAKLHPETLAGGKAGYLRETAIRLGFTLLGEHISPWALFDLAPHVYTVSSQFGFEALLAGCKVSCFGLPFYAGWGLTDDRMTTPRRTRRRSVQDLAAAALMRYSHYFDAWTRKPIDAAVAADQLAFLRRSFLANTTPIVGYRIARWKQRAVSAMLEGPHGRPVYTRSLPRALAEARRRNAAIAAWGIEAMRLRPRLADQGIACIAVEDGFLRSAGLGSAFVQPLSLVFDKTGLYFDGSRTSDIETALATADIADADVTRAAALRQSIIARGLTKYNVGRGQIPEIAVPPGRPVVLVPGQVADDWAVLVGRPGNFGSGNVNEELLARVRAAHPEAFVIFKPHPDVEDMGRAGAIGEDFLGRHADFVARNLPIDQLLGIADRVETYSSLAGFEALLRSIPVAVYGCPFYAGWSLTQDHAPQPRRGRRRTVEELAAVALLGYPRYWDAVSGQPCPPELALDRIAGQREARQGWIQFIGLILGRGVILARRRGAMSVQGKQ